MIEKWKNTFAEHWAFIITLFITYALSFVFVVMSVNYARNFETELNATEIFRLLVETLVPTTVAYMLGGLLVNIYEIFSLSTSKSSCLCNLTSVFLLTMYLLLYSIYMMNKFSTWFAWIIMVATIGMIVLSFFCYREKYFASHRRHGLS